MLKWSSGCYFKWNTECFTLSVEIRFDLTECFIYQLAAVVLRCARSMILLQYSLETHILSMGLIMFDYIYNDRI